MPLCLYIGADAQGADDLRVVIPSPPDYSTCQFVALTPQEFQSASLQSVFAIPSAGELSAAWQAGFLVPMTLAMVAWAVGKILSIWR
ncbi:MAG: hypothetical protein C3F19_14905 [Rhodocyclales bacterium]|nr:MAG: hypothetical protein C3F19_14905 [Rhodocyclales bacterium]